MPWQECSKVDQRLRFVARLLEGEKMADGLGSGSLHAQDPVP